MKFRWETWMYEKGKLKTPLIYIAMTIILKEWIAGQPTNVIDKASNKMLDYKENLNSFSIIFHVT